MGVARLLLDFLMGCLTGCASPNLLRQDGELPSLGVGVAAATLDRAISPVAPTPLAVDWAQFEAFAVARFFLQVCDGALFPAMLSGCDDLVRALLRWNCPRRFT